MKNGLSCFISLYHSVSELEATASRNLQQDASGSDIIGTVEETLKTCAQSSQPSDLNASSYQGDYK